MNVMCAHTELVDVPGWPNYHASPDGRIISKQTGLPLKEIQRKDGYLAVRLFSHHDGRRKVYKLQSAHRLVCAAFHGESNLEVNHKDGDKANNRPENLEWATRSQNIRHSIDVLGNQHVKPGYDNGNSRLSKNDHALIVRWHKDGVLEPVELAKFFGVNKETIMIHLRKAKRIAKSLAA